MLTPNKIDTENDCYTFLKESFSIPAILSIPLIPLLSKYFAPKVKNYCKSITRQQQCAINSKTSLAEGFLQLCIVEKPCL